MHESLFFFFQAEDGIRDLVRSRGLGDVYKRQPKSASTNDSLYQIRNDIDHGNIVEYDFAMRTRVINGLNRLQPIILSIIGVLLLDTKQVKKT